MWRTKQRNKQRNKQIRTPLLSEQHDIVHLKLPPAADKHNKRHRIKSLGFEPDNNKTNNNSTFEIDISHAVDDNDVNRARDVLSDSEFINTRHLHNTYAVTDDYYNSDNNASSPLNKRYEKETDADSNKSMPLTLVPHQHNKQRYKSMSNASSTLLSPPRYHKRKKKKKKKRGYEYHISQLTFQSFRNYNNNNNDDASLDSDYTSIYAESDDDEAGSHYLAQLKRRRQMKKCCCCFTCKCCLNGLCFCKCISFCNKICTFLHYYKWFILLSLFMLFIIFFNVYCFSNDSFKKSVNKLINNNIFNNIGVSFDLLFFCQIVAVISIILVLINLYLLFMFYKTIKQNALLLLNEAKHKKQISRGRQRSQNIYMDKQHINELYNFTEQIWNRLLMIHENFAFWNKKFNHNLNKINDKTNKYISDLWQIYAKYKKYDNEIEGLILMKLKNDIEKVKRDNIMLLPQFDNFITKIPKRYRKTFNELKSVESTNIDVDKIYFLLRKLLENYNNNKLSHLNDVKENKKSEDENKGGISLTSDRLSNEPPSISNLIGGYLVYGDQNEPDIILTQKPNKTFFCD